MPQRRLPSHFHALGPLPDYLGPGTEGLKRRHLQLLALVVVRAPITPSRCKATLKLSPSQISRLGAELARRGLVVRSELPDHRGHLQITPTEAGRALDAQVRDRIVLLRSCGLMIRPRKTRTHRHGNLEREDNRPPQSAVGE